MVTELPTKVMLGQTLVLMQMTFLNNVRKVGRLVLSRTSCIYRRLPNVVRLKYSKNHKWKLSETQEAKTTVTE
jgi:hypothetical protein